jgi:hypothetical protein
MGDLANLLVRFILGGTIVSAFALIGEIGEPKTFAGIFGAAPSVALASLALAFAMHGESFAVVESRSMMLGALAFIAYSCVTVFVVQRHGVPVWFEAACTWVVWLLVACGSWWLISRAA